MFKYLFLSSKSICHPDQRGGIYNLFESKKGKVYKSYLLNYFTNFILYNLLLIKRSLDFVSLRSRGHILLIFSFFFLLINFVSAQALICDNNNYYVQGPLDVKQQTSTYYIKTLSGSTPDMRSVVYKLYNKDMNIATSSGSVFSYTFSNWGLYTLEATVIDRNNCAYLLRNQINVYRKFVYYIGENVSEFNLGLDQNFFNNGIRFDKYILTASNPFLEETVVNQSGVLSDIIDADIILINTNNYSVVLDNLGKLSSKYNIDLKNKEIFISSSLNLNFQKRILAKYINSLGVNNIFVLKSSNLLNLFSALAFGKDISKEEYITPFSVSFEKGTKILFLSYLIDYLIYTGFPISIITLMLLLPLGALLINIFRQIVGLSVFGIYSPLLFAICILIFGFKISIILLIIAGISSIFIQYISSRIYLLYNAKIALLITFYFFIAIVALGLDKTLGFNIISTNIFNNNYVIFPILLLIVIADKVFYDGFDLISREWWTGFFEFMIVSLCIYFIINLEVIKYVMLSYPELLIIIFFLNVLVGRFTGLQILEYVRFMPLIRKYYDEEE